MRTALVTLLLSAPSFAKAPVRPADRSIDGTIAKVEQMPWSGEVTSIAARHGLSVVNVTWEDTGRFKGSSIGPNISDMTIGVRDSQGLLHPMPVFRFDNFSDKTADVSSESFMLSAGNERGAELRPISLADLLQSTRAWLHDPGSWKGRGVGLWDDRDSEVLVSAQACFLPVPKQGEATFTPVLYNYQSYAGNPAVLTIVATREGTSIQVIENDGGYMSEVLYFNADGQRAPFTATRQSDAEVSRQGGSGGVVAAGGEDGANVVLLVQVPLKQKQPARGWFDGYGGAAMEDAAPMAASKAESRSSDVENAVIGHGQAEGPFTEIHDLEIERDTRFPVRVTVQLYKATSNGVVNDRDVAAIRRQIDRIYGDPAYVSSLVTDGHTGRSTEWVQPPETAQWAPSWPWFKAF